VDRSEADAQTVPQKTRRALIIKSRYKKKAALVVAFLFFSGCATYMSKTDQFRSQLRQRQPVVAAESLKEKAFAPGNDQVVYLLEYATAQQMAANFPDSTQAFLQAEDLTDIKDYVSITRNVGALLLNEGQIQYKGDDYEKLMINAMLARKTG
jgi:uncharacterized protein